MSPEVALGLNRIGLILDLIAFWFAAPELLGDMRLKAIHRQFALLGRLLVVGPFVALPGTLVVIVALIWRTGPVRTLELILGICLLIGALYLAVGLALNLYISWPVMICLFELDSELTDVRDLRLRSLRIGALVFMFGITLQILATF